MSRTSLLAVLLSILTVLTMIVASPQTAKAKSWACTVTGNEQSCPKGNHYYHAYPRITMSNGWNTYVANNCWANPSCRQVLRANSWRDWQVTATEPARNTSVRTGPELQQQLNDWCPAERVWDSALPGNCAHEGNTPIAALKSLTSTYTEYMPHNRSTIAEAAYDIWTNYPSDIMIWLDNVNRKAGGADLIARHQVIVGQAFDVYRYGGKGGELIFSREVNGRPGTFAQRRSDTAHILGVLRWVQSHGYARNMMVGLIDFTFEICSTGGKPETFGVSRFTMTGIPR